MIDSSHMRTVLRVALCLALAPMGFANDTIVTAETAVTPLVKYDTEGQTASVAWYLTSDSPRKDRQVAQTLQAEQDGVVKHFAIATAQEALVGFGQDAAYSLVVYESATRPGAAFAVRKPVLEQRGLVVDGEGGWLVFPLSEELSLKAGYFYTFALQFTTVSSGNRVLLKHSAGDEGVQFRWHRSGRDRWVKSSLSLHYMLY